MGDNNVLENQEDQADEEEEDAANADLKAKQD